MSLSVVMPCYRRLGDLRRVFPLNARYLARPDLETVLVLDEPSEESEILALLDRHPAVRCRVLVNDEPHDWRPPSRAINVGLRSALGRFVLVVSPESLFIGDVPSFALRALEAIPNSVSIGRVAFSTYRLADSRTAAMVYGQAAAYAGVHFFGSIAAPRDLFCRVRGYDESLTKWGGDDDNIRARMALAGAAIVLNYDLKLVHLSEEPRPSVNPWVARHALDERMVLAHPTAIEANPNGWGVSFGRVARDWTR